MGSSPESMSNNRKIKNEKVIYHVAQYIHYNLRDVHESKLTLCMYIHKVVIISVVPCFIGPSDKMNILINRLVGATNTSSHSVPEMCLLVGRFKK